MTFLNSLDKLRNAGGDKWTALCPAHGSTKNRTLNISQLNDGSFICHCFSCGANGVDIFNALGLPLDELFGFKDKPMQVITQRQKDEYALDKWVTAIYENTDKAQYSYKDHKRYKLAKARMIGIENLQNQR